MEPRCISGTCSYTLVYVVNPDTIMAADEPAPRDFRNFIWITWHSVWITRTVTSHLISRRPSLDGDMAPFVDPLAAESTF